MGQKSPLQFRDHFQVKAALILLLLAGTGCAIAATRPVQEMSDTASAIRAAREVKADTLAPELYRLSKEWFQKARREYKLKNFKEALEYSEKAKDFAEKAEFEAVQNGGNRERQTEVDPFASSDNGADSGAAGGSAEEAAPGLNGIPYESAVEQKQKEQSQTTPPKTGP